MATPKEDRKYDYVVFGATGVTGKYVAEELYRIQNEGSSLTWAAAGRNEKKVREALQELGIEDIDIIVADVSDQDSLEVMCSQAKVIIDVVGPYVLYGEPVVKACINQRCDFVDITGETYFIELMISKYGEQAKEAGVYIVSCCGFDSIPNDIGAVVLQKSFNGQLAYIESFVETNAKVINIGTFESALRSIQSQKELTRLRKASKTQHPPLPDVKMPKRNSLFYSDLMRGWCIPFLGSDRACMMRTAQYRHETENIPMYRVKAYFRVGSLLKVIGLILMFSILLPLSMTRCGFNLLMKYPSFFTFGVFRKGGPTKEEVKSGSFSIVLTGHGYGPENTEKSKTDASVRVRIQGSEPGYVATSALMVQAAVCLVNERDNLPKEGGFYSPGAAFCRTNIVENLEATGKIRFKVEQP